MAKPAHKSVNFRVDRGIRINSENIFPSDNPKKPVVISIRESLAHELVNASKGEIVTLKATKTLIEKSADDAELDAAFGAEEK